MRICVATMHPRLLSGQVESVTNLARGLRDRGHDVRLLTTIHHVDLLTVDHEVLPDPATGIVTKLYRLWRLIDRLIEGAGEVDLLYWSLPTPSFSLLGDYLALKTAVPVVVGFEAHLVDRFSSVFRALPSAPWAYLPRILINNRVVARLSPHLCRRYVVASAYQRGELLRVGVPAEKVTVLPNLIDLEKVEPLQDGFPQLHLERRIRGQRDKETRRQGDRCGPLVTYVGHFNHVKGVDLLIRAFKGLEERATEKRSEEGLWRFLECRKF